MRLELFGGCKVESDELSNSVLFGLFFVVLFFLRLPCHAGRADVQVTSSYRYLKNC